MTSKGHQLVEEYLHRFDNAAVFLAEERRAELRQEIVEHIQAGTEEAEAAHAEAVRAVLERLGPPADIVASETDQDLAEAAPAAAAREDGGLPGTVPHKSGRSPSEDGAGAPAPPERRRGVRRFAVAAALAVGALGLVTAGAFLSSVEEGPAKAPQVSEPAEGPAEEEPSATPTEKP